MKVKKILKRLFFELTGYIPGENKDIRLEAKVSERIEKQNKFYKEITYSKLLREKEQNGERKIDMLIDNLYQFLFIVDNLYNYYDYEIEKISGDYKLLNCIIDIIENDYGYPETKLGLAHYLHGAPYLNYPLQPYEVEFCIKIVCNKPNNSTQTIKIRNFINHKSTIKDIEEKVDVPVLTDIFHGVSIVDEYCVEEYNRYYL